MDYQDIYLLVFMSITELAKKFCSGIKVPMERFFLSVETFVNRNLKKLQWILLEERKNKIIF